MKADSGLTLWIVVIQLLVVFKLGFVSGVCDLPGGTSPSLIEPVPIGTVIYNLTADPWTALSSTPSGFIKLAQNSGGPFYIEVIKEIDVEVMKVTVITVTLTCNGAKTLQFFVTDVNEFPPQFTSPTYSVNVNENVAKGTVVFNAATHVTDADFTSKFSFLAQNNPSTQVPPDGVASNMFEVTGDGLVKVMQNLDFETEKKYTIDLLVQDENKNNTAKLTITLLDVNDLQPAFIVSNTVYPSGVVALYTSKTTIGYIGELTITNGPIQAKDTEVNNHDIIYSIDNFGRSNYFKIDSSSGKVSQLMKLPADVEQTISLSVKAKEDSPEDMVSSCLLTITVTNATTTTTDEPTTTIAGSTSPETTTLSSVLSSSVTLGENETTIRSIQSTLPTELTSPSPVVLPSVTPGPNQTTADSPQSALPTELTSPSPVGLPSVTPGTNQTAADSSPSALPTGVTSSSPVGLPSVTPGPNQTAADSSESPLPTELTSPSPVVLPSVTPGPNQTAADSSQSALPTELTSPSPVGLPSVTSGTNQTTADSSQSALPKGSTSSSSLITPGPDGTATTSERSTSPPATYSPNATDDKGDKSTPSLLTKTSSTSSLSSSSVTIGQTEGPTFPVNSTSPPATYSPNATDDKGDKSTPSLSLPVTTSGDAPEAEAFSNAEFYGTVGALICLVIILIIVLFCCLWFLCRNKRDRNNEDSSVESAKPSLGETEFDNVSKNSSKMNGIENNAADLTDRLEKGQLPEDNYADVPIVATVPPSRYVNNTENEESVYTSLDLPTEKGNSDDESPIETIITDDLSDRSVEIPIQDGINGDTESQLSTEAPVMTFADLSKTSSVSFADGSKPPQHDSDDEGDSQKDGLSYVDHINDGGDDNDDDDLNSENKPGNPPNPEEMTWLVADNDGGQGGSPMDNQQQLSHNNEIGYSPLLDDSQRGAWGNDATDSSRL